VYQTIDDLLANLGPESTAKDYVAAIADFVAEMRDEGLVNPRWPIKRLGDVRATALRLCILPPDSISAGIGKCLAFLRERFGDVPAQEAEAMIQAAATNAESVHGVRCWLAALSLVAVDDAIEVAQAAPNN
jgi:hypothetical protein